MITEFKSHLIADVGISMGDEGKGRLVYEIIDELKAETGRPDIAAIVLKVNGGANSGHTAGGLKLNLLPAGVIEKDVKILAIGSGVVADPRKFLWEGKPLEARGYEIFNRLLIDERTMVSDIGHRLLRADLPAPFPVPGVGVVAVQATQWTPLQKQNIADTRPIQRTEALHRMDATRHGFHGCQLLLSSSGETDAKSWNPETQHNPKAAAGQEISGVSCRASCSHIKREQSLFIGRAALSPRERKTPAQQARGF